MLFNFSPALFSIWPIRCRVSPSFLAICVCVFRLSPSKPWRCTDNVSFEVTQANSLYRALKTFGKDRAFPITLQASMHSRRQSLHGASYRHRHCQQDHRMKPSGISHQMMLFSPESGIGRASLRLSFSGFFTRPCLPFLFLGRDFQSA